MSLLEYGRILLQRGWLLVLCVALGAGAMFAYSNRQQPIYQSRVNVLLQPANANSSQSAASTALINSYVVYLYTNPIAAQVSEAAGLGISSGELLGRTQIGPDRDRSQVVIAVNDTDGENANRVALAWAQQLIDFRNAQNADLPQSEHINAILQDFPRFEQNSPRTLMNVALGSLGGLLLGGLGVFWLEYRRHRVVRNDDDLRQHHHLDVLATVPSEAAS